MTDNDSGSTPVGLPTADARRRRLVIVVLAAVLGVALIAALIAFWPRTDDPSADPSATATTTPSSPSATAATPEADPSTAPPTTDPAPTVEPGGSFPELDPVPPTDTVSTEGIDISLANAEAVEGEAVGPGEIAGAAIRLTVALTNNSDADLNLDLVVVSSYVGGERTPAETFEKPGGDPFHGTLAPGESVHGVYLFRIPEDQRSDVTVVVDYLPGLPAAVFQGTLP